MKILIMGAAGFVGSSLAESLIKKGYEVVGVDNLSFGYIERISSLATDNFEFIHSSVEDFCRLKNCSFDILVNCAAIAPLPENQTDHFRSITQNVSICGAIVDFCCNNNVRKIIHFSSSAVYENGNIDVTAAIESDSLQPRLMYPVSKYLSEEYLKSQYENFDLDITSVRLFNLYGPKQDYFRKQPPLLGYLIRNILTDNEVTLFANSAAKRDYVYIDDLVSFLEIAINREIEPSFNAVNIGSGNSYSVYELVSILEETVSHRLKFTIGDTEMFWGKYSSLFDRKIPLNENIVRNEIDKISLANISKAKDIYGWRPHIPIEVGIKKCVDYARTILL